MGRTCFVIWPMAAILDLKIQRVSLDIRQLQLYRSETTFRPNTVPTSDITSKEVLQ